MELKIVIGLGFGDEGERRWLAMCPTCKRQTQLCATYQEPLERAAREWWLEGVEDAEACA